MGDGVISRFDYAYDADGQINHGQGRRTPLSLIRSPPSTIQWTSCWAQCWPKRAATNILNQYVYNYDKSGNRTGQQIGANPAGANYNNLNQLYNIVSNGLVQFSGNITKTGVVSVADVSAVMTNQTNFAAYVITAEGPIRCRLRRQTWTATLGLRIIS